MQATGVSLHSLIPAHPPPLQGGRVSLFIALLPCCGASVCQQSAQGAERRAQRHAEADSLSQRGSPHLYRISKTARVDKLSGQGKRGADCQILTVPLKVWVEIHWFDLIFFFLKFSGADQGGFGHELVHPISDLAWLFWTFPSVLLSICIPYFTSVNEWKTDIDQSHINWTNYVNCVAEMIFSNCFANNQ